MKKIDLGQGIGILANFGVIVGIVFLAVELQQNSTSNEADTYQAMSDIEVNQMLAVAQDTLLSVALSRTFTGISFFDDLSEEERAKLNWFYYAYVQRMENTYNQNRAGLVDDRIFESYGWNGSVPTQRAFREYWFRYGRQVNTSESFNEFFEEHFGLEPP